MYIIMLLLLKNNYVLRGNCCEWKGNLEIDVVVFNWVCDEVNWFYC